jgi:hypothetical protein
MLTNVVKPTIAKIVLATGVLAASILALPRPAAANEASTAAIVAAAALVVGAIAYDSGGRPYYLHEGRRFYVAPSVANYYRSHRWNHRRRPH